MLEFQGKAVFGVSKCMFFDHNGRLNLRRWMMRFYGESIHSSRSTTRSSHGTDERGKERRTEQVREWNRSAPSAALDTALAQVEKSFGKGSAMRLGDRPEQDVEVIPTGSLALDMALGIGGLPKGRIVEIYGPESSGKTTLALHVVANAQKAGGVAAFIDAEHALDPVYARKLGVDTDSLIVSQPDNGEQALEIADMLIRSGALDVIVIDSVAALVPKSGNRRRDGRQPCRPAGAPDESGVA